MLILQPIFSRDTEAWGFSEKRSCLPVSLNALAQLISEGDTQVFEGIANNYLRRPITAHTTAGGVETGVMFV